MLLFPPTQPGIEMKDAQQVEDPIAREKFAAQWAQKFVESRAGMPDPYTVWVKHRQSDDIRTFNLNPKYPGRTTHALALWTGPWRLATEAEIKAEEQRMHTQRVLDAKRLTNSTIAAAEKLATNAQFQNAVEVLAAEHAETKTTKGK